MRLQPIKPTWNILIRVAFWISKRKFGKVLMPLKVIYARNQGLMWTSYQIEKTMDKHLSLDPGLITLIRVWVSMLNGCAFCKDIAMAQAVQKSLGIERFNDLDHYRNSSNFSAQEKAALTYVEEANHKQVDDATFEELKLYFSDTEIVEITWVQAAESYYNAMSVPLSIEPDGIQNLVETRKTL